MSGNKINYNYYYQFVFLLQSSSQTSFLKLLFVLPRHEVKRYLAGRNRNLPLLRYMIKYVFSLPHILHTQNTGCPVTSCHNFGFDS
jgi:hypothetical protein